MSTRIAKATDRTTRLTPGRPSFRVALIVGLRAGVAGCVAAAALVLSSVAAGEQTYADPSGDAGVGSDLTSLAVRNDASGVITVRIQTAQPLPLNHGLFVAFDADRNPATGSPPGIDAAVLAFPTLASSFFFRWDGTQYVESTPATFRVDRVSETAVDVSIGRTELPTSAGFGFVVLTLDIDGNAFDGAPDEGWYIYDFPRCSNGVDDDGDAKIDGADPGCAGADDTDETDPPPPPLKLTAGQPRAVPGPVAGKSIVVSMTVRQSNGLPFSGAVTCSARAGTKKIATRGKAAQASARCIMRLPHGSRGRKLRGTITARAGSSRVTKAFVFTIR